MAVGNEIIPADEVSENRLKFRLTKLVRQKAGKWFAHVEMSGEVSLHDGRAINVMREVSVGMNQQTGRKRSE